jgi:type VI protein secretion system component VasK
MTPEFAALVKPDTPTAAEAHNRAIDVIAQLERKVAGLERQIEGAMVMIRTAHSNEARMRGVLCELEQEFATLGTRLRNALGSAYLEDEAAVRRIALNCARRREQIRKAIEGPGPR